MLTQALETLKGWIDAGNQTEILDHPSLPTMLFIRTGGELREQPIEPAPRRHQCLDLESLGRWCDEQTVVWYSMDRVEAVLDDEFHRLSTVAMPLTVHPKFLTASTGFKALPQKGVIDWIRQNLREEFKEAAPGLEATVRKLKFSSGATGEGEVSHQKESFSKSVVAEVTGADALPEDLTLIVPVWEELETVVSIDFGLWIDSHEATLSLVPKTGTLVAARNAALGALEELVSEPCSDAKIYRGMPRQHVDLLTGRLAEKAEKVAR